MLEGFALWRDLSPFQTGLLLFFLGLVLGSFTNVIRHRVPLGWSIVTPRSRCPVCMHPLSPQDLIPVLSFVWLRGRCRHCRMPISPTYLVMELAAGLLAGIAGAAEGWGVGFLALAVWLVSNVTLAHVERHYAMRDESGVTLIETVVALGLLTAVAIPMLDFGSNVRGGTPFQRQMAVSLASSKVEDLLNYSWLSAPWPASDTYTIAVGAYWYDLEWNVSPFSPSSNDDFPAEASQLRKATLRVTCQNCTRPMPPVRMVAVLAKP